MKHTFRMFTKIAGTWSVFLAIVATAGITNISSARADATDAKNLLKAMSDYLAAQKAISFDYDVDLELVSTQQQKIALASSGSLILNRPDKVHLTRTGGFANAEMVFDGKTLTLLGKNTNLYAQVDAPGTIDQLVDALRDKSHRPVPAADLLISDPYKELMSEVNDVKDLGSGVIHGVECDHLAFRTKEVDWQIWIAQEPALILAAMSSQAKRLPDGRNTPSIFGHGKRAPKSLPTASNWKSPPVPSN
jgi:hypothetical protein